MVEPEQAPGEAPSPSSPPSSPTAATTSHRSLPSTPVQTHARRAAVAASQSPSFSPATQKVMDIVGKAMAAQTGMDPESVKTAFQLLQEDRSPNWADMTRDDEAATAPAVLGTASGSEELGQSDPSATNAAQQPQSGLGTTAGPTNQESAPPGNNEHSEAIESSQSGRSKTPSVPLRPRSTRVAAAEAAKAAAAAETAAVASAGAVAAATEGAEAAELGLAARTNTSVREPIEATALSHEDAANAAIAAVTQAMEDADKKRRDAANARTKAYAGLMAHIQKMCADGHVDEAELEMFLAVSKACHRHGEGRGSVRPFPRQMVTMMEQYDPEHPLRSLQPMGAHPSPAAQIGASPATYGAIAARAGAVVPPHMHRAQPDPIQQLKDKCIVGQAKGSAQLAALSGGRRVEKILARLEQEAPERKKDPIDLIEGINRALVSDGAAAWVRAEVAKHCPTGVAIFPRRSCGVEHLLAHKDAIAAALGSSEVVPDEEWDKWVLYSVPTHAGSGAIDEDYLYQKVNEVFGDALRGKVWRLCKRDEDWTKKEVTPITFSTTTRANLVEGMPVRMLGRQFTLRRHKLRPDSAMCASCGSYKHKTESCKADRRCRRCSAFGHSTDEHGAHCAHCKDGSECVPLCMHCRGPHVAGDKTCRNRPTWSRHARAYVFTTGAELSRINTLGDRSRNRMIRTVQGPASGSNAAPLGPRTAAADEPAGGETSQSN